MKKEIEKRRMIDDQYPMEDTFNHSKVNNGCGKNYLGKNSGSYNKCGTLGCLCPECMLNTGDKK